VSTGVGPGASSGVSIIDQLSAAAAHGHTNPPAAANTAALFDDFPVPVQQQQDPNP